MRKARITFLLALSFITFSCAETKEAADAATETVENAEDTAEEATEEANEIVEDQSKTIYNGIIKDYTSTEGCGFLIEIEMEGEMKLFDPVHLQEEYKRDGLKVQVSFTYSRRPSKCTVATPIILESITG